jgi:hypothetical protein
MMDRLTGAWKGSSDLVDAGKLSSKLEPSPDDGILNVGVVTGPDLSGALWQASHHQSAQGDESTG